jgi:hypothetical protein
MARPSKYSVALTDRICERLMQGESLVSICSNAKMPTTGMVYRWLNKIEEFRDRYARAREIQADTLADQILDISNTPVLGITTKSGKDGVEITEGDMIQHRRLQVDARKWYASKLAPKKYGDKIEADLNHSGGITVNIKQF